MPRSEGESLGETMGMSSAAPCPEKSSWRREPPACLILSCPLRERSSDRDQVDGMTRTIGQGIIAAEAKAICFGTLQPSHALEG